jgi:hypothetical protein
MAFHAFHTLSFPWPAFRPAMLKKPLLHPTQCAVAVTKPRFYAVRMRVREEQISERSGY